VLARPVLTRLRLARPQDAEEISDCGLQPDPVHSGVERDGGDGQRVGIAGDDRRRACYGGGDGHQARPGRQIEHHPAADAVRLVEQIPGERLAAGPRERPERRGQLVLPGVPLDPLPQPERIPGQVQPDLRQQRRRGQPGVRPDERPG
jgi:hypothetical protein